MTGKLLGRMGNVSDLDSEKQLIRNVTVVIHDTVLVSTTHTAAEFAIVLKRNNTS